MREGEFAETFDAYFLDETPYNNIDCIVLENTNAYIDFSKSFQNKVLNGVYIQGVKLDNVDLSHAHGECVETIADSSLKNTKLQLNFDFASGLTGIYNSDVENLNFSGLTLTSQSFVVGIEPIIAIDEHTNLAYTGIHFETPKVFQKITQEEYKKAEQLLRESLNGENLKEWLKLASAYHEKNALLILEKLIKSGKLVGCFVNEKKIL